MITSQSIQRLALSAALLVLPLIIYCSEISGSPQPEAGSADKVETVTSAASSAADGISKKDEAQTGFWLTWTAGADPVPDSLSHRFGIEGDIQNSSHHSWYMEY
jgi:hypothetical protein